MEQQRTTTRGRRRGGQLVGLLLISALMALFLLSPVRAQETLVRIEIDAPVEPVPKGEEFGVLVQVEDVQHLAGFDFTIEYDPKRLQPLEQEAPQEGTPEATPVVEVIDGDRVAVRGSGIGEFLTTSERREGLVCSDPFAEDNKITVSCVTTGPPLCLEGLSGASGSGLLGRVLFKSKGGGSTTLELVKTTLVLDDVQPCDPAEFIVQEIPHRREGASVELIGGDGPPWLIIGPSIGVGVLLLLGGGLAGFRWYRRRGAGTPP